MNIERGLKRIVFLISIVVALGVGVYVGVYVAGDMKGDNEEHERYQCIIDFWEIWEKGGTVTSTVSGKVRAFEDIPATGTTELRSDWKCNKKEVVKKLTKSNGSWFIINGKSVYLKPYEVFSGADKSYVDLSLEELEEKAKVASEWAILDAKRFMDSFYKYTPTSLIILYSSLAGLGCGVSSFIAVWIAFYVLMYFLKWVVFPLFKWPALGFCEDKKEEKVVMNKKQLISMWLGIGAFLYGIATLFGNNQVTAVSVAGIPPDDIHITSSYFDINSLDFSLFILWVFVVVIITVGLIITFKDKRTMTKKN